jgi:hypothetical protein
LANQNPMDYCKLCKKYSELQLSHVIPKFVGKWIKKTSAVGHIRNAVEPNVRIQDLFKDYLLCKDCEKRFSALEKHFSKEIFYPFHEENKKFFHYDTWLQKFVVSINWRIAVSGLNNHLEKSHPSYNIYLETLEAWRKFLLDVSPNPGPSKNHIVFVGITDIKDFNKIQPAAYNHFMNMRFLRSVDACTEVDQEDRIFIYANITGIVFVSQIHPKTFKGWTNQTKVTKRGTLKTLQDNFDTIFGDFLSVRMSMIKDMISSNISEKQEQIINNGILGDLDNAFDSKSLGLISDLVNRN